MKSCVVSKRNKYDAIDTLSKVILIFLSVSTPEIGLSDKSTDTQTSRDDSYDPGYEAEESSLESSPSHSPFIPSFDNRTVELNSHVGLPAPHHDWSGNADGFDNYWRTATWRHWDQPYATHGMEPHAQSSLPSDSAGQSGLPNVTCYENVTSYQAAQRPLMASVSAYTSSDEEYDMASPSKRVRLDSSAEQSSTSKTSQSSIVAEAMDERSIAKVGDSVKGQGQDTAQDQRVSRELRTLDPSTPEYFKYAWFYPVLQRAASQAAESQAAESSVATIDNSSGNFDVTFGDGNNYVDPTRAPEQESQSSTTYPSYPSWFEQSTHTAAAQGVSYEAGMEHGFIEPNMASDRYLQDHEVEATRSAYPDLQRTDTNDLRACLDETRPSAATQTFAGATSNFLPSSDVSPLHIPTLPLLKPLRSFLTTHIESQSPASDTSSNEAMAKRQPYIESIRELMKKAMSGKPILQKKPRRSSTRPKKVIDIPEASRDPDHHYILSDALRVALRQNRAEEAVTHLYYPLELSNTEEKASAVEQLKANLESFLEELRMAKCQFTNIYSPCQNDFFLTAHERNPKGIYVRNILGMLAHMVDQYSDKKEVDCDDRVISIVPRNYLCVTTAAELQGAWEVWSVLSKYVTVKGVKGTRCLLSWSELGKRAFWRMYVKWTGLVIGDKDRESILFDAFIQAGLHKMLLASILDNTYRTAGSLALWNMSFELESDEARKTFEMLIETVDRLITDGSISSTVSPH